MFTGDTLEELPADGSTAATAECSGLKSMPGKLKASLQCRAALPVVHIRTRPTLEHLGEAKDQRRVWRLDHQNIVVCSKSRAVERRPDTSSLGSENVSLNTPSSPSASATSRGNSASPTAWKTVGGSRYVSPGDKKQFLPKVSSRGEKLHEQVRNSMRCRGTPSFPQGAQKCATPTTSSTVSPNRFSSSCHEEHFTFDFIHGEDATQSDVFEESLLDFVEMALLAQSIAIVCYGPTGSGKTYSMIGAPRYKKPKSKKIVAAKSTPSGHEKLHLHSALRGRSKSRSRGELPPSSFKGNTTTSLLDTDTVESAQQSQQRQQRSSTSRSRSVTRSSGRLSDLTSGLRSSGFSHLESCPSPTVEVGGWGHGRGGRAGGYAALEGVAGSRGGEELEAGVDNNDEMGLLPRLVYILLERRGEPIRFDLEGVFPGAQLGRQTGGAEKSLENGHRVSSLTLQELTFYGVELYMDEYRDLLDPLKRPISNVGDIGGLEAFCERMNNPPPSTLRGNSGAGKTRGNGCGVTFQGGGMPVSSVDDFHHCYYLASRNRVTMAHQLNDASSRSHAVFILQLRFSSTMSRESVGEGKNTASNHSAPPSSTKDIYSYVAMVDLAGSERVKDTKVEGHALREAQYINKSLSALSAVLLALHQRSSHIPYRDSKLTRLLRPCFERGHVLALVHVSPCSVEETLNSLKFAEQVRHKGVRKHNFINAPDDLVAVFEDLNDPELEELSTEYHKMELEYTKLCSEVRLAYLSRIENNGAQFISLPFEMDGAISQSSLPEHARNKMRGYIVGMLTERHVFCYRLKEDEEIQEAARRIWQDRDDYIRDITQKKEQEIGNMKLVVGQMRALNAQLAEENSQPVLRDAHAMAINQRLKDISDEVTSFAKERLLFSEGIRLIRQRLTIQEELERCLDEQLQHLPKDATAAVSSVGRASVDENMDEEMEEICRQQLLLSKEMSLLRNESACFVRSDELWEGLWARGVRQELLLAHIIQMEMMEGIIFDPRHLRWAIETCGVASDEVENLLLPLSTSTGTADLERLLTALITTETPSAIEMHPHCRVAEDEVNPTIDPISITLSNGDVIRSASTLIGCYDDEEKLQEASVQKLLQEGIFCEMICLPEGMSVDKLLRRGSSMGDIAENTSLSGQWGCLRLLRPPKDTSSYSLEFYQRTYAGGDKARERRVVSIPLGESQLQIILHVIEVGGILDILPVWGDDSATTPPALPAFALELRGISPFSATRQHVGEEDGGIGGSSSSGGGGGGETAVSRGTMRLGTPRLADLRTACNSGVQVSADEESVPTTSPSAAAAAAAAAAVRRFIPPPGANTPTTAHNVLLGKRLECGGELLLPAFCMAAYEAGSGTIMFHFPERIVATSSRTEAVECVVAALSGLTVPMFGLSSEPMFQPSLSGGDTVTAEIEDVHVATYQHVPYVLLTGNGCILRDCSSSSAATATNSSTNTAATTSQPSSAALGSTLQRGLMGMSLLGYASRLEVRFYFQKNGCSGAEEQRGAFAASCTPREPIAGLLNTAIAVLDRLGIVVPSWGAKGRADDDAAVLLSRMRQLHALRRKLRAMIRQQIFDAEDIKAELLYSYSDSEFMRGSHIKKVLEEARELIDVKQLGSGSASPFRGTVHATPALCRECCGTRIPWTLWHWAHRWATLQEVDRQQRRQQDEQLGYLGVLSADDDDDDSEDGSDGGDLSMKASPIARRSGGRTPIVFEELPCFLIGM